MENNVEVFWSRLGDLFWWYNRLKIARFLVQVLIRTNHTPEACAESPLAICHVINTH